MTNLVTEVQTMLRDMGVNMRNIELRETWDNVRLQHTIVAFDDGMFMCSLTFNDESVIAFRDVHEFYHLALNELVTAIAWVRKGGRVKQHVADLPGTKDAYLKYSPRVVDMPRFDPVRMLGPGERDG